MSAGSAGKGNAGTRSGNTQGATKRDVDKQSATGQGGSKPPVPSPRPAQKTTGAKPGATKGKSRPAPGTSKKTAGKSRPASAAAKKPRGPERSPREVKTGASTPTNARDLLELYRPDLARLLADGDAPLYRYEQVFEHLFRRPLLPFGSSTVLPPDTRAALDELGSSTLVVSGTKTAKDRTTKLLLTAADGATVEMVVMRYSRRVTACISSQVGCPVGCAFCATGLGGLERNLSAAEIVDQVRIATAIGAEEGWRLSNLVYMGMGEPLLNLQAVLASIRILTASQGLDLGHRSISISTVGIPAGIRRLARSEPQVNLALSLHGADDRTRARLVPETFRHPLANVLAAGWDHFEITHRKLLVEYVLLEGVNDSLNDAKRLAALLQGHVVTVNLLAWNPVSRLAESSRPTEPSRTGTARKTSRSTVSPNEPDVLSCPGFRPSSPGAIAAFRDALAAAGVEAVVRQSKGGGIDAACGQLAGRARRPRKDGQTKQHPR